MKYKGFTIEVFSDKGVRNYIEEQEEHDDTPSLDNTTNGSPTDY